MLKQRIKKLKRTVREYKPQDNLDFIFLSKDETERRRKNNGVIPWLNVIGIVVWPETKYLTKEERNDFRSCYDFFKNINNERFYRRFGRGDGLRIYERRLKPIECYFYEEEEYVHSLTDLYKIMKKNGINYDFKQYGEILRILDHYLDEFDENVKSEIAKH